MDTLTHIVLGACIGEVVAGKQLGKKVLVLGAIAQNIPDIDFIASFWLPTSTDLLAHRGFTHSFLFLLLLAPMLAWLSGRFSRGSGLVFKQWLYFWALQLFVHIFIDAFNAYGTGWFEPFSHYRVSFNTMFVADPLFSIWLAIGMAGLAIMRRTSGRRKVVAGAALVLSTIYLLLGVFFKIMIDSRVNRDLSDGKITGRTYFTTPTPLNNLLWYVVVADEHGYHTGYSSVFDRPDVIRYRYQLRNDSLLDRAPDQAAVGRLLRFSQGFHTAELRNDTLLFNDLRFGEQLGWEQDNARPVLYYYLQYPDKNKLIVQRGRFAGWNKEVVARFIKRIGGNQ